MADAKKKLLTFEPSARLVLSAFGLAVVAQLTSSGTDTLIGQPRLSGTEFLIIKALAIILGWACLEDHHQRRKLPGEGLSRLGGSQGVIQTGRTDALGL